MRFPEKFRYPYQDTSYSSNPGDPFGVFFVPPQKLPGNRASCSLRVIASDGSTDDEGGTTGWEHVSCAPVKLQRCPTWDEMEMVRELFWEDTATVVQFSVARAQHVNIHQFVLHLWRSTLQAQPLPPSIMV